MRERRELFEAIRAGELPRVRALLAATPGLLAARSEEGSGVVLWALYARQDQLVEELCAAGAEIDLPTAVAMGELAAVAEGLALEPALADRRSSDGFPPLCLAAYFGRVEVLRLLLVAGADPEAAATHPTLVRPLHSAVAHRGVASRRELVAALLAAGADPRATQHGGFTPLMQAAALGDDVVASELLAAGADSAVESDAGQTAADCARARGHTALAASLAAATSR